MVFCLCLNNGGFTWINNYKQISYYCKYPYFDDSLKVK